MSHGASGWGESSSRHFIDWGRYFVPEREEQLATLAKLVPATDSPALVVELCCGEGLLAEALLERHASLRVLALDASEAMREHAARRLARFGERARVEPFQLEEAAWRHFDETVHAFVSVLSLHHLDGPGKQRLFAELASALGAGGTLVIADLVEPTSRLGREFAAAAWDDSVRRRSLELDGDERAFHRFRELTWNYYSDPSPDAIDSPSPLLDQLRWLSEAGLDRVDVFWMRAGHAIYGGRKPGGRGPGD